MTTLRLHPQGTSLAGVASLLFSPWQHTTSFPLPIFRLTNSPDMDFHSTRIPAGSVCAAVFLCLSITVVQ